jgi:sensor c-di-GMP phosphodiesterase-like protein
LQAGRRRSNDVNLEMIAAGIESARQGEYLRALGIRRVQGFHYARPECAEAFSARWRRMPREHGAATQWNGATLLTETTA